MKTKKKTKKGAPKVETKVDRRKSPTLDKIKASVERHKKAVGKAEPVRQTNGHYADGTKAGPRAGMGRPAGIPNRTSRLLKEAILLAAENAGDVISAQQGPGEGIVGYLTWVALEEPRSFCGLLGRVLPLQITGANDGPLSVKLTEVRQHISGISDEEIEVLGRIYSDPKLIEGPPTIDAVPIVAATEEDEEELAEDK